MNNYEFSYNNKYNSLPSEGMSYPYNNPTDYSSNTQNFVANTHRDSDHLGSLLNRNPFNRPSLFTQT